MTTEEIKTVKMIVAGDTYKAREKMKAEGFTWNADDKQWECTMVAAKNAMNGDEGFADMAGNYKGTLASIRGMVKCYAKSEKFTIAVE